MLYIFLPPPSLALALSLSHSNCYQCLCASASEAASASAALIDDLPTRAVEALTMEMLSRVTLNCFLSHFFIVCLKFADSRVDVYWSPPSSSFLFLLLLLTKLAIDSGGDQCSAFSVLFFPLLPVFAQFINSRWWWWWWYSYRRQQSTTNSTVPVQIKV